VLKSPGSVDSSGRFRKSGAHCSARNHQINLPGVCETKTPVLVGSTGTQALLYEYSTRSKALGEASHFASSTVS